MRGKLLVGAAEEVQCQVNDFLHSGGWKVDQVSMHSEGGRLYLAVLMAQLDEFEVFPRGPMIPVPLFQILAAPGIPANGPYPGMHLCTGVSCPGCPVCVKDPDPEGVPGPSLFGSRNADLREPRGHA